MSLRNQSKWDCNGKSTEECIQAWEKLVHIRLKESGFIGKLEDDVISQLNKVGQIHEMSTILEIEDILSLLQLNYMVLCDTEWDKHHTLNEKTMSLVKSHCRNPWLIQVFLTMGYKFRKVSDGWKSKRDSEYFARQISINILMFQIIFILKSYSALSEDPLNQRYRILSLRPPFVRVRLMKKLGFRRGSNEQSDQLILNMNDVPFYIAQCDRLFRFKAQRPQLIKTITLNNQVWEWKTKHKEIAPVGLLQGAKVEFKQNNHKWIQMCSLGVLENGAISILNESKHEIYKIECGVDCHANVNNQISLRCDFQIGSNGGPEMYFRFKLKIISKGLKESIQIRTTSRQIQHILYSHCLFHMCTCIVEVTHEFGLICRFAVNPRKDTVKHALRCIKRMLRNGVGIGSFKFMRGIAFYPVFNPFTQKFKFNSYTLPVNEFREIKWNEKNFHNMLLYDAFNCEQTVQSTQNTLIVYPISIAFNQSVKREYVIKYKRNKSKPPKSICPSIKAAYNLSNVSDLMQLQLSESDICKHCKFYHIGLEAHNNSSQVSSDIVKHIKQFEHGISDSQKSKCANKKHCRILLKSKSDPIYQCHTNTHLHLLGHTQIKAKEILKFHIDPLKNEPFTLFTVSNCVHTSTTLGHRLKALLHEIILHGSLCNLVNGDNKDKLVELRTLRQDKSKRKLNADEKAQMKMLQVFEGGLLKLLCFKEHNPLSLKLDKEVLYIISECKKLFKHDTHRKMGFPLSIDLICALWLYCNHYSESTPSFQMCQSERRKTNMFEWIVFDSCLNHACSILSRFQNFSSSLTLFRGIHGVKMEENRTEHCYFVSPFSTSTDKQVAKIYNPKNGIILKIHGSVVGDQRIPKCDVAWVSNYSDENEILFARVEFKNGRALTVSCTATLIENTPHYQIVELTTMKDKDDSTHSKTLKQRLEAYAASNIHGNATKEQIINALLLFSAAQLIGQKAISRTSGFCDLQNTFFFFFSLFY